MIEKTVRKKDHCSTAGPIAYLLSGFPAFSETFILNEMEEISQLGEDIRVWCLSPSLFPDKQPLAHRLGREWLGRVHFCPPLYSPRLWLAHAHFLLTRPGEYLETLRHHRKYGGKRYFLRSVYFAWLVRCERIRHVHAQFGWSAEPAMLIARLTHAAYSFTLHGSDVFVRPPESMTELINGSAFCVTISEYNRSYLVSHWPGVMPSKIRVIRLGVDTDKFAPVPRVADDGQPVHLLTVARLVPQKNLESAIKACYHLRKQGYRFRYAMVGDGPDRPELEHLIRTLHLEEVVVLRGVVSQECLIPLYQAADVFLLTSRSEGIPVAAMEAMACGLPVVAPRITGMPELVDDGRSGILFEPEDEEEAVRAVARLIDNRDLRRRMGEAARVKVVEEYNLRGQVRQLGALFHGGGTRAPSGGADPRLESAR